jgi:hypothetical protein
MLVELDLAKAFDYRFFFLRFWKGWVSVTNGETWLICFFFAKRLAEWEVAKIFQAYEGIEVRDHLFPMLFIPVMEPLIMLATEQELLSPRNTCRMRASFYVDDASIFI